MSSVIKLLSPIADNQLSPTQPSRISCLRQFHLSVKPIPVLQPLTKPHLDEQFQHSPHVNHVLSRSMRWSRVNIHSRDENQSVNHLSVISSNLLMDNDDHERHLSLLKSNNHVSASSKPFNHHQQQLVTKEPTHSPSPTLTQSPDEISLSVTHFRMDSPMSLPYQQPQSHHQTQ
jgi:hypothetical protein